MATPEDPAPEAPDDGVSAPPPHDGAIAERLRTATELLENIVADRGLLARLTPEERKRLIIAAGHVYRPDNAARRRMIKATSRMRRAARVNRDEAMLTVTGIRTLRRQPVFNTPNVFPPAGFTQQEVEGDPDFRESVEPQHCYVCKQSYSIVHHFYDQMCPPCAGMNYHKRTERADLRGRVALLTGGRVKIGYQAGLKLLRSGAHLIVTTRFPRDSAARYAREPDSEAWAHRLEIFGLDLRHTPSVEAFCSHLLATRERLDFIINNACQTVRRPPDFYQHMMAGETAALHEAPERVRRLLGAYEGLRGVHLLSEGAAAPALQLGDGAAAPPGGEIAARLPAAAPGATRPATNGRRIGEVAGLTHAAELSQVRLLPDEQVAHKDLFPHGRLDQDLQQVDLRGRNSWRLLLAEVPSVELIEVQLVNAIAPFVLNARLKPLMMRTPDRDKHIVNVSAVEGQFYRKTKTTRHPHTNMAKAALNMMTRTSAADYHHDGIHMNSVDTGWVTDEDPAEIAARKTREHRFHPPLDIVDGAARVLDPIIAGLITGEHVWGKFLKDFRPTDW